MTRRLIVEADGGSRGNPGPAGYGALVRDAETGRLLAERAESVGRATNNVAEYGGLVAGLQAALDLDPTASVEVRMDSKLVVEQMSGRWQIKHPDMKKLAVQARDIARQLGSVRYTWVPRAQNGAADALANSAMDGKPVRRDLAAEPVVLEDETQPVASPRRSSSPRPSCSGTGAPSTPPSAGSVAAATCRCPSWAGPTPPLPPSTWPAGAST